MQSLKTFIFGALQVDGAAATAASDGTSVRARSPSDQLLVYIVHDAENCAVGMPGSGDRVDGTLLYANVLDAVIRCHYPGASAEELRLLASTATVEWTFVVSRKNAYSWNVQTARELELQGVVMHGMVSDKSGVADHCVRDHLMRIESMYATQLSEAAQQRTIVVLMSGDSDLASVMRRLQQGCAVPPRTVLVHTSPVKPAMARCVPGGCAVAWEDVKARSIRSAGHAPQPRQRSRGEDEPRRNASAAAGPAGDSAAAASRALLSLEVTPPVAMFVKHFLRAA